MNTEELSRRELENRFAVVLEERDALRTVFVPMKELGPGPQPTMENLLVRLAALESEVGQDGDERQVRSLCERMKECERGIRNLSARVSDEQIRLLSDHVDRVDALEERASMQEQKLQRLGGGPTRHEVGGLADRTSTLENRLRVLECDVNGIGDMESVRTLIAGLEADLCAVEEKLRGPAKTDGAGGKPVFAAALKTSGGVYVRMADGSYHGPVHADLVKMLPSFYRQPVEEGSVTVKGGGTARRRSRGARTP